MTALRTPGTATTARAEQDIKNTWDNVNHNGFRAKVNGIFEIIPQESVRQNYAKANAARDNEMGYAYHGTNYGAARSISATGFIVTKNAKHGRMLGDGVYLARQSSKSVQYASPSYGRGYASGVLMVVKAARGKEVKWDQTNSYSYGLDTLFAPKGRSTGLYNDEWVVRDPQAVLPTLWIDVTRDYK